MLAVGTKGQTAVIVLAVGTEGQTAVILSNFPKLAVV